MEHPGCPRCGCPFGNDPGITRQTPDGIAWHVVDPAYGRARPVLDAVAAFIAGVFGGAAGTAWLLWRSGLMVLLATLVVFPSASCTRYRDPTVYACLTGPNPHGCSWWAREDVARQAVLDTRRIKAERGE